MLLSKNAEYMPDLTGKRTYFEADVSLCSTKTELSICDDKNAKDLSNPIVDKIHGSNSKSICLHTQCPVDHLSKAPEEKRPSQATSNRVPVLERLLAYLVAVIQS